jgi:hypothetical protein
MWLFQIKNFYLCGLILLSVFSSGQSGISFINPIDSKFVDTAFVDTSGKKIIKVIVPGSPPKTGYLKSAAIIPNSAVMLNEVPAFSWTFGCMPTASAMIAGYYDRHGFENMYAGATNNGVCPLNNAVWGNANINGEIWDLCPLGATMKNLDGRTTNGHVDNYWINYESVEPDPYITNGWQQHENMDCTGDYMKSNQSAYGNPDGSTTYYLDPSGNPFEQNADGDAIWGFQQFCESRGYLVLQRYTQTISGYLGNSTGFTFANYKQEIDAGRPVMIHLAGHSMAGVGYDNDSQTIYFHNTWDYDVHSMSWASEYTGMQMFSVSIFKLALSKVAQNIALAGGWNIISANVLPANLNLLDLFQTLIANQQLNKVMDESGNAIENFGAFGGWSNSIGNMEYTEGYKVHVSEACNLIFEGSPIQSPSNISLNAGWNIISYPNSSPQDAMNLFQPLIDQNTLKKVMDESGKTIENFADFGGWKNNIGNMLPGKGYKVNVTSNSTLNIP